MRRTRACCYYHSIDWHRVSAAAIRILRQARTEGLAGEAFFDRLYDLADSIEKLPGPEGQALWELVSNGRGIQLSGDGRGRSYINGRHRITAMLEAGVRRTVVISLGDAAGDRTGVASQDRWPPTSTHLSLQRWWRIPNKIATGPGWL